jgi:hypothetical protein
MFFVFVLGSTVVTFLAFQAPPEAPEVKYTVAGLAAVAAIIVALISAVFSVVTLVLSLALSRINQSALQKQQAALTEQNQEALASLQSALSRATGIDLATLQASLDRDTGIELEATKAELAEAGQTRLELVRSELGELAKARDARRDYEYDAHKRLYSECEPLLFQLAELAEHAYHRIYSLARTSKRGDLPDWLDGDGYYLRSTMYKLMAPLVVFRLIQQRLTFVDLSLDFQIANQYRLLKLLYLTFTDSFDFAKVSPEINYDPDIDDWKLERQNNEKKYWRQGMYLGVLDNSIDALIVTAENGNARLKTYGEFDTDFGTRASATRNSFMTFADILDKFHPKTRPVFWRMLWTQTLIYQEMIESQATPDVAKSRVGLAAISPKLPPGSLDWRKDPKEAPDEDVLVTPAEVAQKYLETRLPEVFGGGPAA